MKIGLFPVFPYFWNDSRFNLAIEGILYLIIKKKYQRKILKDVFENN
ncbi:hypothetical protein SSCHL_0122 [Staphylococcus schleiferi]|nr:hypothetical protein SSCHL_0122 [Staphylococcus schleiferi]